MTSWPGAPFAAAVELLALESRGASGVFRLGPRTITLRRGRIAGVSPRTDLDPSLGAFLVAAGRLSESARARLAVGGLDDTALERAVVTGDADVAKRSELRLDTLRESLRSVWMERLARAFAEEGSDLLGRESAATLAEGYDVSTLALVLDALERCAAGGDAETVGARAQEWVRFSAGPTVGRAKRWAQIEAPREVRVASVLSGSPAAAPRLAALGRAGFLEILPGSNEGPPPPAPPAMKRTSTRPPPAQRPSHPNLPAVGAAPMAATVPESRPSLAPPRAARVQLAPGAARVALALDVSRTFPSLALGEQRLADPLDGPEDHVAALEESNASASARARAWRVVAEVAREKLGALDEHARASREAAAADPEDPEQLRRAAEACTAIEETELALAYGKAVVGVARTGAARARAMHDYALLCRRLGRKEEALQAARAATQVGAEEPTAHVLVAEIDLSLDRRGDAAESFADAAALLAPHDPARAHLMSARAYQASPTNPRAVELLSASMGREGQHEAAIELRAELGRLAEDRDEARRLLLVAAERAELHGSPLRSGALLLEAFDTDPSIEVIWGPLESDLAEAGARRERAIVLEEIALAATDDAGEWWQRAADARGTLEPDSTLELELRTRALVEAPASLAVLDGLRSFSERTGQVEALLSALDRAIRGRASAGVTRQRLAALLADRAASRFPTLATWAREVERTGLWPQPRASSAAAAGPLTRAAVEAAAYEPTTRLDVLERARGALELQFDAELARAVVTTARHEGLDAMRAQVLGLLAVHAGGSIERARLRALEATYARFAGRNEQASAACRDAIAQGHSDAEVATRLRRTSTGDKDVDAVARAAAWAAEAAHSKGTLRARALAELARIDEARGQIGRALELAAEALREDPSCARAALLFLRRDRGEGWQRLGPHVATALRALLGDTPETLRAVALTRTDAADALALAVRWAALDPISAQPIFTSLTLSERHHLPEYDDAAIDALITAPRCEPAVLDPLLRAIERISEREPRRALERALRGAAALGPWGHSLRARAFEIGLAHHDHDGLVRAAESQLASPPGDRATHLRRIAQLRREGGDRAGEARTWVRLLATVPRDDEALHRLAEIYAETGEQERLIAALSLRVEEGATPHERAIGHLELAAAYSRTLGQPERAEAFLAAAETELDALEQDTDDSSDEQQRRRVHLGHALVAMGRVERGMNLLLAEARRAEPDAAVAYYESAIAAALLEADHAPQALAISQEALERLGTRGKLLLAFEQIALDLGEVEAAERTYTALIDRAIGVHGRRALAYRRARWLDRAGATRQALTAYVEACRHQASPGALSNALERLARAEGELPSLAAGLSALAENAPHPTVRLSLLRRTAALQAGELGDPGGALTLLASEWKRTFASELEPDLLEGLASTTRTDEAHAKSTLRELVAEIERRAADAWMGEERAHLLRKAVRFFAGGVGDLETAQDYTWRAVAALRDENAEADALRAPVEELARWFELRGAQPALEAWVARATHLDGNLTSPGEVPSPAEREADAPETSSAPAQTEIIAQTEITAQTESAARAVGGWASAPTPVGAESMVAEPAAQSPTTSAGPETPPGEPTALDDAATPEPAQPATDDDARVSFVGDPRRIADLLHTAETGTPRARLVAQRILAACDPEAGDEVLDLDAARLLTTSLEFFRHPGLSDALAVLRRVWDNALPLFKKSTRELGILGTDRVGAHDTTVLGRNVQAIARLLSLGEPTVYQSRDRTLRGAEVLRTAPPSVRVSEVLARSTTTLQFELARTLELATPERVLLASLPPAEGRNLFAAIHAAFGPAEATSADGRSASRNRDVAMLAADLWSTLPPLAQKAVREHLQSAGESFDYDSVSLAVLAGASRLGLVACGDPRCAVLRVVFHDPALHGLALRDQAALADALERSALLRDLVRFALSDGFVDAVRL